MSLLSSNNGIRGGFRTRTIGTGTISDSLMHITKRKVGLVYTQQWLVDTTIPEGVEKDCKVTRVYPITITRNGRQKQVHRGIYKGKRVERSGYVNGVQDRKGVTVGKWFYLDRGVS